MTEVGATGSRGRKGTLRPTRTEAIRSQQAACRATARQMSKDTDDAYLVWSNEYGWARPQGWGGSFGLEDAAHLSRAEALELCRRGLERSPPLGRIAKFRPSSLTCRNFSPGRTYPPR
jgi:hypothetical protein